jgi:CRP-like cAMP-binding protein
MTKYAEFLKKVPIFAALPDAALADVEGVLAPARFAKNAIVFNQGDPGDAMFVVLVGRLNVVLFSEGGREVILAQLGPGDFFGEMAILAEQPRSATVVATEDATLLRLARADFVARVRANPDIALRLLAALAHRLAEADEKIGDLALVDVYGRVARFLLRLAREKGTPAAGGTMIQDRPTHQEIANLVGTARETVSRAMSDFMRQGLLRIEGKTMILLAEDRLARVFESA